MSSSSPQMWSVSWRSQKLNSSSPQSRCPVRAPPYQSWHTMRELLSPMAPPTPTGPCSPTWLPRGWNWAGLSQSSLGPQRSRLWSTPRTQTCQASRSRPGDSSRMHVKWVKGRGTFETTDLHNQFAFNRYSWSKDGIWSRDQRSELQ